MAMSVLNPLARELSVKIVYYGPGLSGKTTSLQCVHDAVSPERRGKMVSLATRTDRTLFFDFLPLKVERIGGLGIRFQLYTVPGQVFYAATRKLVLKNADGVVFVADSQLGCRDSNLESLEDLRANLQAHGMHPDRTPMVLQYNKRDLPGVMPIARMSADLNQGGYPELPTSASTGEGVLDGLRMISRLVVRRLVQSHQAAERMALKRDFDAARAEEADGGIVASMAAAAESVARSSLPASERPSRAVRSAPPVRVAPPAPAAAHASRPVSRAPTTLRPSRPEWPPPAGGAAASTVQADAQPITATIASAAPVADIDDAEHVEHVEGAEHIEDPVHSAPTGRPAPPDPGRIATAATSAAPGAETALSFACLWPRSQRAPIVQLERRIACGEFGAAVEHCNALLASLLAGLPGPRGGSDPGVNAGLLGLDGHQYLRVCRLDSMPAEALTRQDALLALHLLVAAHLQRQRL